MSQQTGVLEALIIAVAANTAAVEALTAAQGGAAAPADAGSKTTGKTTGKGTNKTTKTEPKSKYTKQQVTDAIVALKDAKGQADAKEVLAASGFAKLAEITEDKFDELYEAATAALGGGDDAGEDDDI